MRTDIFTYTYFEREARTRNLMYKKKKKIVLLNFDLNPPLLPLHLFDSRVTSREEKRRAVGEDIANRAFCPGIKVFEISVKSNCNIYYFYEYTCITISRLDLHGNRVEANQCNPYYGNSSV